LAGDALLCATSVHVAYYLRTNEWAPLFGPTAYAVVTAILLALPIFIGLGLYRAIFRYTGNAAMLTITKAVAIYSIPYILIYTYIGIPGVPRTLGLLQPIVLLLMVVGFRATAGGWL
ncbi:hypothetical protein ACNJD8_21790, partial [Mycobacterium tuberculosis]